MDSSQNWAHNPASPEAELFRAPHLPGTEEACFGSPASGVAEQQAVGVLEATEGSRAHLVATMRRREAMLLATSFAAGQFLAGAWEDGIQEALQRLGLAVQVSRVYLYENRRMSDGQLVVVQRYEWCGRGIEGRLQQPGRATVSLELVLESTCQRLASGEVVGTQVRDLPETARAVLSHTEALSILQLPIMAGEEWWGVLGFEDCRAARSFDVVDIETLRLASDLLGAAITRSRADQALRQSEAGLRGSEAELRALFGAMTDVILVLDADGRYLKIAPTALGLLYRAPEILLTRTVREVFPEHIGTEFARLIRLALDARTAQRTIYNLEIEGKDYWFEATITPLTHRTVLWVARDITESHEAAQKLEQQAKELETLFQALPDIFFRLSPEGHILDYKTSSLDSLVVPPEQFLGKRMDEVLPPDVAAAYNQALHAAENSNEIQSFEYALTLHEELCFFEARLWKYSDAGYYVVIRDISERREAEEALRQAEAKYRSIFENAVEGIFQSTPDGFYMDANPSLARIYGYTSTDELRLALTDISQQLYVDPSRRAEFLRLMREEGRLSNFESQVFRHDGEVIWISENARAVCDLAGEPLFFEGTVEDISKRKQAEERLLHDAMHDRLTGLANRALFLDRVGQAMARLRRHPESLFAVLFLDCDRFKNINDSLGHMAGDQLLVDLSKRLSAALRPGDTVARLGGDEFGVLLEEIVDMRDATHVAERIQADMSVPFSIGGQQVFTTASMGIAVAHVNYEKAEDLLRDADMAMYRAKATGKARHEVFDSGMHTRAVALLQLETDLRWAIERHEFRVHYQPIVDLNSRCIVGFEALVRWQHPERGLVPPDEFVPVAEETGFIVPIGNFVVLEAVRQLGFWQREFPMVKPLYMAVNLSGKQFSQPALVEELEQLLAHSGLAPGSLMLEITESAIMENAQSVTDKLLHLQRLGVNLALDDFGTGYSSLSYLHRLPLDTLKIDRSFVSRLLEGGENRELVSTIIILGLNLGMDIVAEGVEKLEELEDLLSLRCGLGQGYYFSQPLPANEAEQLLISPPNW